MTDDSQHILGKFQRALDQFTTDLNRMADLVVQNLENAVQGLLQRDSSLCAQVIADDEEIDSYEIRIDKDGLNIMMLYHPVASDLRKVISTMKASSDLERVGDLAVGIAKRARKMNRNLEIPETRLVEPIYEQALSLLRLSLSSFQEGRLDVALEVKDKDADLDKAYKTLSKRLRARMEEDPSHMKDYLDLQFIARFMERVGDHAKNIAEDAVFAESAMDIRHGGERPDVE